jgi:hypothetical protein
MYIECIEQIGEAFGTVAVSTDLIKISSSNFIPYKITNTQLVSWQDRRDRIKQQTIG